MQDTQFGRPTHNEAEEKATDATEYLQMGQVLLGAGKYEESIQKLEQALQCNPMDKTAYVVKGIAYANMEQYAKAKECMKRAIKIDKQFADAYFQLGSMEFLEDHFQEGMKNYNLAISYGYQDAALYYNLALVYEERDNPQEAIRYYTKAASLDETNPEYLIRKASLQMMIGKLEEALQTLDKVRGRFPESFEGYHLTAAAFTLLERYEEAKQVLQNAGKMFENDRGLLFDLLKVLGIKGDYEEALRLIQQFRQGECSPEEQKELLLNEAKIRGQMEQTNQTGQADQMKQLDYAVSLLQQALAIKEGEHLDSEIRYLLLNALYMKRDYETMYKIAKAVNQEDITDPFCFSAMYYLCIALKGKNDPDYKKSFQDAIRYYRNISLKDPSRVDAYLFRAMCYREIEQYDKALEAVDYVLLLQPENAQLHQIKGNLLMDENKKTEAELAYAQARKLGLSQNLIDLTDMVRRDGNGGS